MVLYAAPVLPRHVAGLSAPVCSCVVCFHIVCVCVAPPPGFSSTCGDRVACPDEAVAAIVISPALTWLV